MTDHRDSGETEFVDAMEQNPRRDVKGPEVAEMKDAPAVTTEQLSLGKAIKKYPKMVGYTIGIMTAVLFVGYDGVIVGTVTALPRFQHDFGDQYSEDKTIWILPATWVALWSALGAIGSIFGSLFAGWLQDKAGRKWSLFMGSVISMIAVAIMYCSNLPHSMESKRGTFLASKIINGFGGAAMLTTALTYTSEVIPVSLRGPAMAIVPTFTLLGQLVGAVVIFSLENDPSPMSYLLSFASQWPFALIPLILSIFMPQSPAWLLRKDRDDEALRAEKRLHTVKVDITESFDVLKETVALEKQQAAETSYLDCFKGTNGRRTWVVILASLIPVFFGLPLLGSASYFLQQVGMKPNFSLLFLIIGIVIGFVANGASIWVVSKVGRRVLILLSMVASTVIWLSMGISGIWQNNAAIWYTAVAMMMIIAVSGIASWPASYAVVVETSSLRLRARTQAIGVLSQQVANLVFLFVLPYIFNPDAGNLKSKTGFFYAGVCLVGTFLCWLFVPEMKGRAAAEIDRMFELRLPTRKFKHFSGTISSEQ